MYELTEEDPSWALPMRPDALEDMALPRVPLILFVDESMMGLDVSFKCQTLTYELPAQTVPFVV